VKPVELPPLTLDAKVENNFLTCGVPHFGQIVSPGLTLTV
jgi:hypothetical protein